MVWNPRIDTSQIPEKNMRKSCGGFWIQREAEQIFG